MDTIDNAGNIPAFGIRRLGISSGRIAERSEGEALILSTKRGAELAWRYNKENLNWRQQKEFFEEIYRLCKKSFSVEDSLEFKNDVKHHIFDTHEICVVPATEVPEGLSPTCFGAKGVAVFASYNFLNYYKDFIYFSGIVVDPSLQGLNYGSLLIQEIMKSYGIKTAVLRTQSPVMYNSFAKTCDVFPSFNGKKVPGEVKNIARYVAQNILHMPHYNSEKMTEDGTYGKPLYGIEPILNDPELDKTFKQKVNIDRGDSIIVVGTLKNE